MRLFTIRIPSKCYQTKTKPEDATLSTTYDDHNDRIKLCDGASEIQAHTSQLINDKYRLLISITTEITDLKKNFNQQLSKHREQKENLCRILCEKMPQIDSKMDLNFETQIFYEFDGNNLKEMKQKTPILNLTKDKDSFLLEEDDIFNWTKANQKLNQAISFNDVEQITQNFDTTLESLAQHKSQVQLELKLMKLRCLVIYQELLIIDQFDEPEKAILETIATLSTQLVRIEEEIKCQKFKLKCVVESMGSTVISTKHFLNTNGKF